MSVSLTLCIFKGYADSDAARCPFIMNMLVIQPPQLMLERLKKVGEFPVYQMQMFKDEGLKTVHRDAYGDHLWAVSAATLASAMMPSASEYTDQWVYAVHIFLSQLPKYYHVVLYWH